MQKKNFMSCSDEVVGAFVKELTTKFEKEFRRYKETGKVDGIQPEEVVKTAVKYGVLDCGYQIYMLALGLYCGCLDGGVVPKFDKAMQWCQRCFDATMKLANSLDVPIEEIDPIKALHHDTV